MHVVVVGCGRVGARLATELADEGHSVAVVDRHVKAFNRLPERFTGTSVVGVGFDRERLREAGIERADALVAVTSGDNTNVLVARVARDAFGVERIAARIYDPKRAEIYERLGIPTVASVQWTTDRVKRRIGLDGQNVEWTDPSAMVQLVERQLPARWAAVALADIELVTGARAIAVSRNGASSVVVPSELSQDGDVVWFAIATDAISTLDEVLAAPADNGGHH
ncbi:MAG: TrkA family potassium uptake protein [Actinomycetes bacterium]